VSKDTIYDAVESVSGPALFWYESRAVAEALKEVRGLSVIDAGQAPPTDGKSRLALSIPSHGTGWNLQAWHTSVVLEPPANGQTWEQLIGRTHRTGQEADTVYVHVLQHTGVFIRSLQQAREHAQYIEQTQGLPQRLNYADFERQEERRKPIEQSKQSVKGNSEVKPLNQLKKKVIKP